MNSLSNNKTVLRQGKGLTIPADGAVCTVVIQKEGSNGERKELIIGENDAETEWIIEDCCKSMKSGEIAQVTISTGQTLDYSKQISQKYTIEMVSFEQAKYAWELTPEERLDSARTNKEIGSELYKAGKYRAAARRYCKGVKALIPLYSPPETLGEHIDTMRLVLYLNLAMCQIKTAQFEHAVKNCSKVLEMEPGNTKGLYRRGFAYMEVNKFDLAEEDIRRGAEIEPDNKAFSDLLRKLCNQAKITDNKFSNAMKSFFTGS